MSQLYQWKRPRSRPGTKRSGRGRRLGAPPMMARRHGLQARDARKRLAGSSGGRRRRISVMTSTFSSGGGAAMAAWSWSARVWVATGLGKGNNSLSRKNSDD